MVMKQKICGGCEGGGSVGGYFYLYNNREDSVTLGVASGKNLTDYNK